MYGRDKQGPSVYTGNYIQHPVINHNGDEYASSPQPSKTGASRCGCTSRGSCCECGRRRGAGMGGLGVGGSAGLRGPLTSSRRPQAGGSAPGATLRRAFAGSLFSFLVERCSGRRPPFLPVPHFRARARPMREPHDSAARPPPPGLVPLTRQVSAPLDPRPFTSPGSACSYSRRRCLPTGPEG